MASKSKALADNTAVKQPDASASLGDITPPEHRGGVPATTGAGQDRLPASPLKLETFSADFDEGVLRLVMDQATNDELNSLLSTTDVEFQKFVLGWLASFTVNTPSSDCTEKIRRSLIFMRAIEPRNEAEAMIALQMVAANEAGLEFTRRTLKTDRADLLTAYANAATKFQRTAIAQAEALAKLRRGGAQIVKHVHVGDGGQAVIAGTVNNGGRGHG